MDRPLKPWVKICGLTQVENALDCAAHQPDAIGLVFFEKSPRNVTRKQAKEICDALPDSITPVGVFVDADYEFVMDRVKFCGLKGVQLHGQESPKMIDRLLAHDLIVIKALFATREPFLDQSDLYSNASFLLVEYGKGVLPGGNAESWDYEIALQLKTQVPVVLAGGLDPENVNDAVTKCLPGGVDISSGVEATPGMKDVEKVRTFIQAARS